MRGDIRQTVETLTTEETRFAKFLRNEQKTRIPKIVLQRPIELSISLEPDDKNIAALTTMIPILIGAEVIIPWNASDRESVLCFWLSLDTGIRNRVGAYVKRS